MVGITYFLPTLEIWNVHSKLKHATPVHAPEQTCCYDTIKHVVPTKFWVMRMGEPGPARPMTGTKGREVDM